MEAPPGSSRGWPAPWRWRSRRGSRRGVPAGHPAAFWLAERAGEPAPKRSVGCGRRALFERLFT
eukprot:2762455-Alexandrium_andersonii.AAC.1